MFQLLHRCSIFRQTALSKGNQILEQHTNGNERNLYTSSTQTMYDGKPDLWSHLAHLCKILNLLLFLLCILVIVKFHLPRDHICLCAWHLPVLPVPAWVLSGLSSFLPQYKGPQMSAEPRTFCITGWPNKEENHHIFQRSTEMMDNHQMVFTSVFTQ